MKTRIIEATQDIEHGPNWGKFLVGEMDSEWDYESHIDPGKKLLSSGCGWHAKTPVWVMDLQTREGAVFAPHGSAHDDLEAHRIWVCVLYEPFLEWLYAWVAGRGGFDLDALPPVVELPDVFFRLYGYRRPGPVVVAQ